MPPLGANFFKSLALPLLTRSLVDLLTGNLDTNVQSVLKSSLLAANNIPHSTWKEVHDANTDCSKAYVHLMTLLQTVST